MEPPPPSPPQHPDLDFDNIQIIKVLGKGAMGTVFLVHDSSSSNPFALKVVEKSTLQTKHDGDRRARWEIQVLSRFRNHPFLPSLIASFETHDFLAWAVPYCPGGDLNVLRYHQNDRVFSPTVLRFYLSEIITALQHLHEMGIVYRDLKPENILVQETGHVTLTDFDLSRTLKKPTVIKSVSPNTRPPPPTPAPAPLPEISPHKHRHFGGRSRHRRAFTRWAALGHAGNSKEKLNLGAGLKKVKSARVSPLTRRRSSFSGNGERSNSFVGTEEYVSPEVVRGDGYEFAVDWWALGVLTYEMTYGTTPFKGRNRKETFRNVLAKKPEFVGRRSELTDLIERLLEKDPCKRLGYARGASEIKEHAFFKGVKWEMLTEVLRPPFIPCREYGGSATKAAAAEGADIRGYFKKLREPPPSLPPSPIPSPSPDWNRNLSEF